MAFSGSEDNIEEGTSVNSNNSYLVINSDENYILVDNDFTILSYSHHFYQQYLKFFGKEISVGNNLLDLTRKERVDYLRGVLLKTLQGEEQMTEIDIPYNNEVYIIQNKYKPAIDDKGNKIGIFVTSRDITEIRKTETEKRALEKEAEFERQNILAVINNTQSLIWSFDREYRLLIFNEAFAQKAYKIFNTRPKQGDSFLNFEELKERAERFKLYSKRAFGGESYSVIEHTTDPEEAWLEISFNPIYEKKNVVGVACTATNVTERKLFEKSLIKSKNDLKQAQEIAHVGHWELNFNTKAIRWSDEAYRIYGIDSRNFDHTFESWMKFIHPEDLDYVNEIIKRGYETLESYSVYHRIIRPDGEIRHIYGETHFKFDATGVPIGIHGISQDITDRKNNEIKLQELLKNSNVQNKWLNNFTHIVSHNLRSHNNNIQGIVKLMDGNTEPDGYEQLIKILKGSTDKLNETINNLSEYIRLQNNSENVYKLLNIKQELDKTCSAISQLIHNSGAEIRNLVSEDVVIKAIPSFVESIFLNLITNAIKYRSENRASLITISSFKVNTFTCVKIEDNGRGIDLNKFGKHIFGMFQTFHGNDDAIGFGLFITKNQIEAMDGKIEIESTPNKGTTFTIYFHEKN